MVGRSVENAKEIRAYIKTHALLGKASKDIYADICTVSGSNSMSFSTVSDGLGNSVQTWNLLQVRLNLVDLNLLVVKELLKKLNY